MAASTYYKNIQKHLLLYADLIEQSNSLGLSDEAISAENLFCSFLNTAFGWNLVNVNEQKINQSSFDLIDKRRGLVIQITSNKSHKVKFNKTVATFLRTNTDKHIKHLIVLFISRKCADDILGQKKKDGIMYEAYDIPTLLSKVYYKNKLVSQLKDLNQILQDAMAPVLIQTGVFDLLDVANRRGLQPQSLSLKRKGLFIERNELIEKMYSFAQESNGLIIGDPGVGKSFTIEELQRLCYRRKVPCFILRINELLVGSDEEINKELKSKIYWINALKKISLKEASVKGLLIFDAFDTAKDEKLKSTILKQIKEAINELRPKWRTLVSARTFDAAKSSRLLELFPQVNITRTVTCRFFEIPDLSDLELNEALKKNLKLNSLVQKCGTELKNLLKTPYFLKLLERIVIDNKTFETKYLSQIDTEEQLLEVFWKTRIANNTEQEVFLRKFTQILAANENLSSPKGAIITDSNHSIYDNLVSSGVISESSITKENITFSHNILLDFAISKYLIVEDPVALIEYVEANPRVPFLFRQSFIYFYSKLWKKENQLFWKHYFKVRSVQLPLFRLYHQTILNYILGGFYTCIKELSPVFELPDEEERGNVIRKILEGIRFIGKGEIRNKDFLFLHKVSTDIHEVCLWELGFLIGKAIASLKKTPNPKNNALISKAASNYLKYVLERRKSSVNKYLIEVNGGHWGIDNVCATFVHNRQASARLIKGVLALLKETDFPIRFFLILSNNLLHIYKVDKELALLIYTTLYYHTENSDKETYLGNSVVLSLRSNRRQDFGTIHHKLEKDYKDLVRTSPKDLIPMGLGIVNKFSIARKTYRTIGKAYYFLLFKTKVKLTPDYSYYDSEHDRKYGPMSHMENTFEIVESKLVEGKTREAVSLVKLIAFHSDTSTLWRRLIKLFIDFNSQLKNEAFALLSSVPIFLCDETVYDAGELLKTLWPSLSVSQKKKLENTILSIRSSKYVKGNSEIVVSRYNRLLNCIPFTDLSFPESRDFISVNGPRENKAIVSRSIVERNISTKEEKIAQSGIDSTNQIEVVLFEALEKIEPFNSKYDYNSKDKPLKSEYEILIDLVTHVFQTSKIHSFSSPRLKSNYDFEICRFVKLLTRLGSKLNKSIKGFILEVASFYINADEYKSSTYERGNINNDHSPYVPTPRSAAAETLVQLLYIEKTSSIGKVVLELMSDNIQIIRFKSLHALPYFWHHDKVQFWYKVKERSAIEQDGMCIYRFIDSIYYGDMIRANQPGVEEAACLLMETIKHADGDASRDLWHIYVVLILRLLIIYDSKVASTIINQNFNIKEFSRQLLFEILAVVDPHSKDNNYQVTPSKYQNLIKLIEGIIIYRFKRIKEKGLQSNDLQDDFEIIDTCIQHLFFTIETGKKDNKGKEIESANKAAFFNKIQPILSLIVDESAKIDKGFMVAHTGYYFMQLLNNLLPVAPEYVLTISTSIVNSAAATGFTYDHSTLGEIVKLTEKILADHKELLYEKDNFNSLITILDLFANSGWQEALELTWRLKEVF